ncbi:hypothetical protein GCM10009836_19900 [Pseudonocardia ailaonensis]|uniref:Uncharacterized protein n=1 Tax=Pseudonocardia ailaonensis TaxID=367279 RepID=A0ABN2MWV3_9PSEU
MTAVLPTPHTTLRRAFAWHRPLMTLAVAMAVLLVVCVVGLIVDDRVLTGVPIWTKPTKFALSTLIYAVTWAWLIALVRGHRPAAARWTHRAGTVAAVLLGVELAIITVQVLRGTTSHFNQTTPLNAALFQVMAVSIVGVWLATLYTTAQLFRVRDLDPARSRAIRAGAVVALVGMALGFLMTRPFPGQIAAGGSIIGAHTVGVADGGAGLPFLGWSTVGGDLRIPHFVGMHALQALPLLLIALELLAPRIPVLRRIAVRRSLLGIAAVTYLLVLALTTWQALRGQSIVAPDAITLTAGALIAAAALTATALTLLRPHPRESALSVGRNPR